MKPYYDEDGITIYHGDCREVVQGLPRAMLGADVAITDPPYGFGAYPTDNEAPYFLSLLVHSLVGQGSVAIFGYPEQLVSLCIRIDVEPQEWVTWWPTNLPGARTPGLSREAEHIAIFGNTPGASALFRPRAEDAMTRRIHEGRGNDAEKCRLGDVWRDPSPGAGFNGHLRLHPNEKPLSVMQKLVQLCSRSEQTILDPFMGSGTTLRAAKDLGRRAIGVEIEERYCEIAVKRLGQMVLDVEAV